MNLKINLQTLNQLSIIYISLPLLIFLATWLKPYIAIITFVLFVYIVYCGYFKNKEFNYKNLLNVKGVFIITIAMSLVWCYFSGMGGFWYQSDDYHWRNAIFRDLINYDWPVYYKSIKRSKEVFIDYFYNLVLSNGYSAKINDIETISLGHCQKGGVAYHPYYGTEKVIQALKKYNQYNDGKILIEKKLTVKRDENGRTISYF